MNLARLPSNADYQALLACPQLTLLDPELRASRPQTVKHDMPRVISGNFAAVFEFQHPDGRAWAVKCFTRQLPEQARYQRIHHVLSGLGQGWRMGFDFLARGLRSEQGLLPILKMEWVQGEGLDKHLEAWHADPERLSLLALRFAGVLEQLERAGLAHGDLQHGNILVSPQGAIRLVDYDGMFVPGLEGFAPTEQGHPNYQSPLRRADHFGRFLDRFSAWVIYGSLVVLAARPELWNLRRHEEEALLFTRQDYEPCSPLLDHLAGLPDERCRAVAEKLREICRLAPESVPPLAFQEIPPPVVRCPGCRTLRQVDWVRRACAACGLRLGSPAPAPAPTPAPGPTGPLPDWLRDRMGESIPRPGLLPAPQSAGAAPIPAPTPPAPPSPAPISRTRIVSPPSTPTPPTSVVTRLQPSGLWLGRLAVLGLALWTFVPCALLAAGPTPLIDVDELVTVNVLGAWLLVSLAGMRVGYENAFDGKERSRRLKQRDALAQARQAHEANLERRIADLRQREKLQRAEFRRRHNELDKKRKRAIQEIRAGVREAQRALDALEKEKDLRRAGLEKRLSEATANVGRLEAEERQLLAQVQQDWEARLARGLPGKSDLKDAKLPGFGVALKDRLEAEGFVSAADVVGYQLCRETVPQPSTSALLVHRDGRKVRVFGIGPEKARALLDWSKAVEAATTPQHLALLLDEARANFWKQHDQERTDASATFEEAGRLLPALEAEFKAKRQWAERLLREAQARVEAFQQGTAPEMVAFEQRRHDLEEGQARLEFETRRLEGEARGAAAGPLAQAEAELARAQADLDACKAMEFLPYLKAVLAFWI